jgi:adenine specific DNA methylase Mod
VEERTQRQNSQVRCHGSQNYVENPDLSYHAAHRVSENDLFDNRLNFCDNLLALKALEREFRGKIKYIYIAPPYNTGNAFELEFSLNPSQTQNAQTSTSGCFH